MIDSQLRTSGVNTPFVLDRMSAVSREQFVPDKLKSVAYMDRAVPLGDGRFLAAPLFYGRMLEEAAPRAEDEVLVVSGGSHYVAELVRPLVAALDVMQPDEAVKSGRRRGDYTLLLIDGAIEELPDTLAGRLADNARIVTGIVTRGVTRLAAGRKAAGEVALVPLAEMGIPILPEFAAPKGWAF
jgi:protein-L-isoaspartate(D-aspartate) O-methyltransferase